MFDLGLLGVMRVGKPFSLKFRLRAPLSVIWTTSCLVLVCHASRVQAFLSLIVESYAQLLVIWTMHLFLLGL